MKNDADVLADGREYIESHGWWRGELSNPRGEVCGLGGIAYSQDWVDSAGNLDDQYLTDVQRVALHLVAALGAEVADIPYPSNSMPAAAKFAAWNDKVAPNKQAVLDLFAKAEKIARAGFDPDA